MSRLRAFAERHRRRLPYVVLAVAAAAHLQYAAGSSLGHTRWDSDEYLANARSLAAGAGFRDAAGHAEARRTPAYPLFLAPFLAAGAGVAAIVAVQHGIAVALAVAVYALTLAVGGDALAAAIAGLFVALDPGQIYMADVVMTETLMSAALVAAVALLARFARRPSIAIAAAAGVAVSIGVLIKPAAMYLWIPLLIWILAAGAPRRAAAAIAFAAAALALPLLWSARNERVAGTRALSSIVGEDLYYWRAAGAVAMERTGFTFVPLPFGGEEEFRHEFFRVQQPRFVAAADALHARAFGARAAAMSQATLSALDGAEGWRILRAHPAGAMMVSVNGALHLLFDSAWEYAGGLYGALTRVAVIYALFAMSIALVALAVAGFVRLRRRDATTAWLFAAALLYFVAVLAGPEHEQWRYRVPLTPLFAVLAGCSVLPRGVERRVAE